MPPINSPVLLSEADFFLVDDLEEEDFLVEDFFSSLEDLSVKRPVKRLPTSTFSSNTPTKSPIASLWEQLHCG